MTKEEIIKRNHEAFEVEWKDFDPDNKYADDQVFKMYCENWFCRGIRAAATRTIAELSE